MTQLSISGKDFLLNGKPTYPGRVFEGHRIEGLLFNVRAVQATFDDANPETRRNWTYQDTGEWDPERNVTEFCEALPSWRDHGVLAFTINIQGGGPLYIPEIYQNYNNNGFTPEGELKPAYADRIKRVLACADELGMVVIIGLFYWVNLLKMRDEKAIWHAAHQAMNFLGEAGYGNVMIEIANEIEVVINNTDYDIFSPERSHEMIDELREAHPEFLYSTSHMASNVHPDKGFPPDSLMESSDFVLLHGNGTRPPRLGAAIRDVQAMPVYMANPKPIIINEDSPAVPNLDASWKNGASWGYYDQGFDGQADNPYERYQSHPRPNDGPFEELNGFQTPPVNWTINSRFKRDFFTRVAEVTGYPHSKE